MADMPHQIKLLQTRLQRAEQDAMEFAAQADHHANNLAVVMEELRKHDPEFIAAMLRPPQPPAPPMPEVDGVPAPPAS